MAYMTEEDIKNKYGNQYTDLRNAIIGGKGTSDMLDEMSNLNRQANQARGQGDTITATKDLDYLRGLIPKAQAVQQPQSAPRVRNNSGLIKDSYAEQRDSIVAQIRAAIAQSRQGYNNIIQDAPQQFQGAKNQAELGRVRGIDTLRETIANRGDSGGIGRSQLLQADIAGQNTLNSINQDQNKVITDAQRAIQNLEEQGRFQEAQATADNAYQMLQAIANENSRVDNMNLDIANMLGSYGGQRTLAGQQLDNQIQQNNIDNSFRQNQFDYQKQSDMADRDFRDKQFEESIRQNNISQSNWEKTFTYQQMQDKIQNALASKRISQDSAQLALSQLKFKADQDPNSLDNQIKKVQLDMAKGASEAELRDKAAQLATSNGVFDQNQYTAILNALKGNATSGLDEFFK